MTPQLWQGVSGSPVGEQRLMLAAAQQGMTDTVRMQTLPFAFVMGPDRAQSVWSAGLAVTSPHKQDLPSK